ncbi:MAG TPA: hypothetical protein VKZ18_03625 [Polyangia bacterium]|nr:hypothetical protein [Polyangia bacterium]
MSDLETQAWQRARKHRLLELGAAIVAGGGLVVMLVVFYSILTR